MDKQEYLKKSEELRNQMAQLNQEYIDSNKKYEDGTKIKVTNSVGKVRVGVVRGHIISLFNNDVVPYLKLVTKDNEESSRNIVVQPEDRLDVLL